ADVTALDAGDRLVAACEQRLGGIDVLVNCAGTSWLRELEQLTEDDWEAQWQLNVRAPERLMRAAAPRMAQQGWGRIVNVASSSGKRPSLRNAAYSVTKAAELSLSRVYADAFAGSGVLVNAVAPGITASSLWTARGGLADQAAVAGGGTRAEALEAAAAKVPLGRFAEPDEIAAVVVFLCSERASDVAGAAWSVDGGSVPGII
ncbi:MAG: SDR family oxidoreductase, partial [Conexibacter sp.]